MQPVDQQLAVLRRGVDRLLPEGELEARLERGEPLRVKLGVDPTASRVHLGWAVVLRKLRQFQELGHTAVLIMGDFTARVGDPSEQSETRRRLPAEEVERFAADCLKGVRRVLLPENLEIRYNSEWLAGMSMEDLLELTSTFTVARMLERQDFAQRFAAEQPISLLEFVYPLLQGMDSVAVEADVELGGADQLWNLLAGRDIQERYGQEPQVVLTVPLLIGTDGSKKMSQSLGNFVGIDDPPEEMFGKVMSIPDELMPQWFELATSVPLEELKQIRRGLERDGLHPGEVKRRLARRIVAENWSEEAARQAEEHFDRVFVKQEPPSEMPELRLGEEETVWLPGLLREAGLAGSSSEAKRLIAQGAVKVGGRTADEEELARRDLVGRVLQVGKRRFVKLVE